MIALARSASSIELEQINHQLTLWHIAHPQCSAAIREYIAACRLLDAIAGPDDALAAEMQLDAARAFYRRCYGTEWRD